MADSSQIRKRKEPRFKICEGTTLACDTAVGEGCLRQGSVVDVSSTGMRILCEGRFEVGQSFATELKTDQSHGIYGGVVRRVQPWVAGQSILGCQLSDPIPDEVLEELAEKGIVNRRSDDRTAWDQPASMSWELHPGEIDIHIHDYSSGGMKVYSEHEIPEDVRLRIRVESPGDDDIVVAATTVWKQEDEDGYQAGLAFTNRDAPELIDRLHRKEETSSDDATQHRPAIRPAIMVVAAIVLLTVTSLRFLPFLPSTVGDFSEVAAHLPF